jgi:hypothetical protein
MASHIAGREKAGVIGYIPIKKEGQIFVVFCLSFFNKNG